MFISLGAVDNSKPVRSLMAGTTLSVNAYLLSVRDAETARAFRPPGVTVPLAPYSNDSSPDSYR